MTNKLARFLAVLMVSLALFTAPVISESFDSPFVITAEAATKKTPAISAKKKTVYYKGTATLKINNYKGKVKWKTSNEKIAKVNSKGVVTGVALGKCTITATAGKKTYKCTVTVADRNVSASASIKVSGGGYFVKGESKATVTVKPKKYNAAKAVVTIENAEGNTVYKKTLTKLKKDTKYTFNWTGKNTKGKYVPTGSYVVKVKIGKKVSSSSTIKFYAKNEFADGNGSKSNPFIVKNITHLKKLVKYPVGYFKQANDIDFKYSSIPSLFTADAPFKGFYNGNKKYIKNISGTAALFDTVGEKGVVYNVKMKNCSVVGHGGALLVKYNYGKIKKCNISGMVSVSNTNANSNEAKVALGVWINYGVISDSTFSGKTSSYYNGSWGGSSYAGGITYINEASGKIISCIAKTDVTAETNAFYPNAGGIAALNNGLINDCEASGKISGTTKSSKYGNKKEGSIVGENNGQVMNCYYTGTSPLTLVGWNKGTIA